MDVASINHDYYIARIIALLLRPNADGCWGYPCARWAALRLVAPQWDRLACTHRAEHEPATLRHKCEGWPRLRRTLALLGDSRHLAAHVRLCVVFGPPTTSAGVVGGQPRQPSDIDAGERRALAQLRQFQCNLWACNEDGPGGRGRAQALLKSTLDTVARYLVPQLGAVAAADAGAVLDGVRVTSAVLANLRVFTCVTLSDCPLSRRAKIGRLAGAAVRRVVGAGTTAATSDALVLRAAGIECGGFLGPLSSIVWRDDLPAFLALVEPDASLIERALADVHASFEEYEDIAEFLDDDGGDSDSSKEDDVAEPLAFLAHTVCGGAVRVLGWLLRDKEARAALEARGQTPAALLAWARRAVPHQAAVLALLEAC